MSTCRPSVHCRRHLPHCLRSNSCWQKETRGCVPRADLVRTAQSFGCIPYHSSQRVYNKHIIIGCSFSCSRRENCKGGETANRGGRGVLRVSRARVSSVNPVKFSATAKGCGAVRRPHSCRRRRRSGRAAPSATAAHRQAC